MKKIISLILTLSLICSMGLFVGCSDNKTDTSSSATEPATEEKVIETLPDEKLTEIQENFDRKIENTEFKGTAYIVYNGQVIYEKSTAKANEEKNIDADINTIYAVGSLTKQFTATAIMLLKERGLLSLDDTIDKYFPNYNNTNKITIDQLLSMRSGIISYTDYVDEILASTDSDYKNNTSQQNRKIILDYCFSQPLNFTPGEQFEYNNTNYLLLGEIIEQVSGVTYHEFIQKEIFEKAEMTSSGFIDTRDESKENVAIGYNAPEGSEFSFNYAGMAFACGDLTTTAADLVKWAEAVRNNTIISAESLTIMSTSVDGNGYGYGYYTKNNRSVENMPKTLWHAGSIPPFTSYLFFSVEDDGYTEILLSNYPELVATFLGERLYEEFFKMNATTPTENTQ